MFRDKESSNRIELSQLVQDLLNLMFWAPCSSGEGTGRWGCLGHGGIPHMCMDMNTHTCIHVQKLQMVADMEVSKFIMFNMHVCVHACI